MVLNNTYSVSSRVGMRILAQDRSELKGAELVMLLGGRAERAADRPARRRRAGAAARRARARGRARGGPPPGQSAAPRGPSVLAL